MRRISERLQYLRPDQYFPYDLLRFIKPSTIADVGAADGSLAKGMKFRSPTSRIFAFEPFPGNHPFLDENLANLEGVTIIKAAVGDRSGRMQFYNHLSSPPSASKPGSSAVGYLVREGMQRDPAKIVDVDVVTIDDVISERIGFLKIDVQGGEAAVLRGASKAIDRVIDIIQVEFDGEDEVLNILFDAGYEIFDTEYIMFEKNDAFYQKWISPSTDKKLSTGATARAGHIFQEIPRDVSGYSEWMRNAPTMQTNLMAVHISYLAKFNEVLAAWKAWREAR